MRVDDYLARLGYDGPRAPTAATLRALHRAHLLAVPFENLDVALGEPITLSVPAFHAKIVDRRRGGFCYELNGLFAWLLRELGFTVRLLSGRVDGPQGPGPEFDHLVLLVGTRGADGLAGTDWLADVGFGDSFREPLPLAVEAGSPQDGWRYHLACDGDNLALWRAPLVGVAAGAPERKYQFTTVPRELGEFAGMCRFHQGSPQSPFTRKVLCSLALPDGRVTLTDRTLLVTGGGHRHERPVEDLDEFGELLADPFGVRLEAERVRRLWERAGAGAMPPLAGADEQ